MASLGQRAAWIRQAVLSVLIIMTAIIWSQIAWTLVVGASLDGDGAQRQMVPASFPMRWSMAETNLLTIADPFFGGTPIASANGLSVDEVAPETNLDLQLYGIRSGESDRDGSAIIRVPDATQRAFQPGDEIMTGVVLARILPDRIVLRRDGVQESLFLSPRDRRSTIDTGRSITARGTPAQPQRRAAPQVSVAALLSEMRFEPRVYNGRIDGFYIGQQTPADVLVGTGLQPGDVVMAVDEVRLVSIERLADIAEELQAAGSARVDIERDGSPLTLSIDLTRGAQ